MTAANRRMRDAMRPPRNPARFSHPRWWETGNRANASDSCMRLSPLGPLSFGSAEEAGREPEAKRGGGCICIGNCATSLARCERATCPASQWRLDRFRNSSGNGSRSSRLLESLALHRSLRKRVVHPEFSISPFLPSRLLRFSMLTIVALESYVDGEPFLTLAKIEDALT